jgi:hypothetical protein
MSFQFEWERAEGVVAPELATTWARLELWIGTDCITQVDDRDSRSSRRSLYCSLYPLAEWAAYNWWFLQAHVRPASLVDNPWTFKRLALNGNYRTTWLGKHGLRGAGDGFPWPHLTIIPEGELTRLLWVGDSDFLPYTAIRYLRDGQVLIPSEYVAGALTELIEGVITRLDEEEIHETALQQEWGSIIAASQDERDFCVAAARLGVDPYTADSAIVDQVQRAGAALEPRLLEEFLDAVDPTELQSGLAWVDKSSTALQRLSGGPPSRALIAMEPPRLSAVQTSTPWDTGYVQAEFVRANLRLRNDDVFDIEQHVLIDEHAYAGAGLQALGGRSHADSATVLLGQAIPDAQRRFAASRSLWHFLLEPERQRFLITDSRTSRQRIERAFAAEVLAPASGISQYLRTPRRPVSQLDAEEVASHFRVSPMVVEHQLQNRLGLTVAD